MSSIDLLNYKEIQFQYGNIFWNPLELFNIVIIEDILIIIIIIFIFVYGMMYHIICKAISNLILSFNMLQTV